MTRLQPRSTLFPYTTLFRSEDADHHERRAGDDSGRRLDSVCDRFVGRQAAVVPLSNPAQDEHVVVHREAEEDHEKKDRSEEHTSELQSLAYLVCRLLLEKKK